ncbi:MFS transporter [Acrocarpospora corrugata]|uniref:MFS transporter n=1 Tax=Acrocarpospora corrugata TaxID=35763 RepID=A0A5M3W0C1_9ACTN|nr:MFS transporter [Acrocarpospora corrugata]GES02495.1 MFS transporter [Acrocarpospora corrugata]
MNAFTKAWVGSFASMLASRIFGVTYPLLALTISNSASDAGWVGFAWALPNVLFYVLAGALVDRSDYRRVMLVADSIRAVSGLSLGVALALGVPTFGHLVIVAFVEGSLAVFHSLATAAMLPTLPDGPDLAARLSRHEVANHVAVLLGRPFGGALFGLLAWVPLVANAVLCAVSLSTVAALPPGTRQRPQVRTRLLPDIVQGFRLLWEFTVLRTATLTTALTNMVVHALIIIFFASAAETVSPIWIGAVVAMAGLGGVFGSSIARISQDLARRIFGVRDDNAQAGRRRWPRVSMWLLHMWLWVLALFIPVIWGPTVWAFAGALGLMGVSGGKSNVNIRMLVAEGVDQGAVGRVLSVSRLIGFGAITLGPLLGGLLVGSVGIEDAIWLLLAVMLSASVAATTFPGLRASFFLPDDPEPLVIAGR